MRNWEAKRGFQVLTWCPPGRPPACPSMTRSVPGMPIPLPAKVLKIKSEELQQKNRLKGTFLAASVPVWRGELLSFQLVRAYTDWRRPLAATFAHCLTRDVPA